MNTAAVALLELSKYQEFKNLVYEKVAEQFDDDDNVLLKTLFEIQGDELKNKMLSSVKQHSPSLASENQTRFNDFESFTDPDKINKAINGFSVWGQKLYSQIYIPFISEVDLTEEPTIVVGHQDGGDCIALGYRPIAGSDHYDVIEVDETYARKHLTWVISTNESVDDNGDLPIYEIPNWVGQEEGQIEPRTSGLNVRHKEFFVTSRKECWTCGKGDLKIAWAHFDANCQPITANGFVGTSSVLEKISQGELHEWHQIDSEFYLIVGGQPNPFPSNFTVAWVVYEHDNKPAINATFPTYCASNVTLSYRSNDTYYGKYGTELNTFFAGNSTFSEIQQEIPYGSQNFRIMSRNAP